MATFYAEFTDDLVVEFTTHNAPAVHGFEFSMAPRSEYELRRAIDQMGFDAPRMDPSLRVHVRSVPMTRDGEHAGVCQGWLWIENGTEAARALPRLVESAKRRKAATPVS